MERIDTAVVNSEINLIYNRSNGGIHLMDEALINQIIPSLENAWNSENSAKVVEKIKDIQRNYNEINAYAVRLRERVQAYASNSEIADTVEISGGTASSDTYQ